VKKKIFVSNKDKKDWDNFTKQLSNITAKQSDLYQKISDTNKVKKLDLHGMSLDKANKIVSKFIIESFDNGFRKILVVTGKGLRSKTYDDPYLSKKLSVLKYSVPEYIKNNPDLNSKISSISKADQKDGGEGAISILLKKK
tara:strand:+ start:5486 stop:5908 length:423 start_codon:yes stop_codon:yes gene_type:complete